MQVSRAMILGTSILLLLVSYPDFDLWALGPAQDGITLYQKTTSTGGPGQGGNSTTSTVYFREDAMRETQEEGEDFIVSFQTGLLILIDHGNKTYSESSLEDLQRLIDEAGQEQPEGMEMMRQMMGGKGGEVTVEKLGPGEEIAGFSTEKYRITSSPMEFVIWAAPELKVPSVYYDTLKVRRAKNPLFDMSKMLEAFKQVNGYSLKTEMTMSMMGMNMKSSTEVTKVERGPIPDSQFEVPTGYRKTEFK